MPKQFWDIVAGCPPKSISRVWYCGHASSQGLMLALAHDNVCTPVAGNSDMIRIDDITSSGSRARTLADRFDTSTRKTSKFYGCYTDTFAKIWNNIFQVPAEGAVNKITFGCIDRPSDIPNILKRLEQTPASGQLPNWRSYP